MRGLLSVAAVCCFMWLGAVGTGDEDYGSGAEQRRSGFCGLPSGLLDGALQGSGNKATVYGHQNAVNWRIKPVIRDGFLVAEGSVKRGDLALNPPGGYATFAVKRRNTDVSLAVVVKRSVTGSYGGNLVPYLVAVEWEVTPTDFRIKAPAGGINVPADLLVWGKDGHFLASPLAIHSIEVVE